MLVLSSEKIRALAPMPRVVECLQQAFRSGCIAPQRLVSAIPGGNGDRLLLSMPAFHSTGGGAVKLVTVMPDNPARGVPTIQGALVVFSETGAPVALLDGTTVTHLRTGGASALASRYLSREDSAHLVIIGTGAVAPSMAEGHCAVRPIRRISVWGRRPDRAAATVETIRARVSGGIEVAVADSLERAIAAADIVSCATSSATAIVRGKWLKAGAFVDLVGSFSPAKREADDDSVRGARIFVDTFTGALEEAGDLLDPLARGIITREQIEGELADLVNDRVGGRRSADEVIVFKSVGTAIGDLAMATLVVRAAAGAERSDVAH